jgi:DNA-binding transcriptional LysR family regulator
MRVAWLDVDLRHLTTFVALAEERSFRATASRLGFAQSAISQHIATLEQRLGERLVERSPGSRRAELTHAGKTLLPHAREILARVAVAERDFAHQAKTTGQRVRLAVFQSVSANLVAPVLARMADPDRTFRVELIESGSPLDLLVAGVVDLAFSESVPTTEAVRHIEIMKDPYVLLTPRNKAVTTPETTLERLADMPLLTYESSCHLMGIQREFARATGIVLRPRIQSDDVLTLQSLAAHGAGFALVPRLALTNDDPRLRATPLDAVRPRTICLSWNAEREPTPAMRGLIEAFVAAGAARIERQDDRRASGAAGRGTSFPPTS